MEEFNETAKTIKAYGTCAVSGGKYDLRLGSFDDSSKGSVWSPNENGVPAHPLVAPLRIKSGAPIAPSARNPQVFRRRAKSSSCAIPTADRNRK